MGPGCLVIVKAAPGLLFFGATIMPARRKLLAMTITPRALAFVALCAAGGDFGSLSAQAAAYCVELTASEFGYSSVRRGDDNACAREKSDIAGTARDRARDNASNAIARQCLDRVTLLIARRACKRVNLKVNALADSKWDDVPPPAKFGADRVTYIGRAGADGPGVCVVTHDDSFRSRNIVDGACDQGAGLLPHRNFAIARARARCAVVCDAP
jgi:hypothetical protein